MSSLLVGGLAVLTALVFFPLCPPLPVSLSFSILDDVTYQRFRLTTPTSAIIHTVALPLSSQEAMIIGLPQTISNAYHAMKPSSALRDPSIIAVMNGGIFFPSYDNGIFDYFPRENDVVSVRGLSIINDARITPAQDGWPVLCLSRNRRITINEMNCPEDTHTAIAGIRLLLVNGARPRSHTGPLDRHPRSAVAIDHKRNIFWMVVVDGRQGFYSQGLSEEEFTTFLQTTLRVDTALELDGGGSSSLTVRGPAGMMVRNSPVHNGIPGRERPVANQIAIRTIGRR